MSAPVEYIVEPDADWVRGRCPKCHAPVVSLLQIGAEAAGGDQVPEGLRTWVVWVCWGALNGTGCNYKRAL